MKLGWYNILQCLPPSVYTLSPHYEASGAFARSLLHVDSSGKLVLAPAPPLLCSISDLIYPDRIGSAHIHFPDGVSISFPIPCQALLCRKSLSCYSLLGQERADVRDSMPSFNSAASVHFHDIHHHLQQVRQLTGKTEKCVTLYLCWHCQFRQRTYRCPS